MTQTSDRELIAGAANPLGMDGIEFVEFSTSKPQALGQVLEMIGFHPIARHRSREVLLYRQGDMNVIVNAHAGGQPRASPPSEIPTIAAFALRVRDAATAYRHAIDRGAWIVPSQVEVMELNIPAIHGVGASRIYFVDRYRDFSIYDVDFTLNPGVDAHPPALANLHCIGFGTPDVLGAVKTLRQRGIGFVESQDVHSEARGALTQAYLGGVMFELVHDERR